MVLEARLSAIVVTLTISAPDPLAPLMALKTSDFFKRLPALLILSKIRRSSSSSARSRTVVGNAKSRNAVVTVCRCSAYCCPSGFSWNHMKSRGMLNRVGTGTATCPRALRRLVKRSCLGR